MSVQFFVKINLQIGVWGFLLFGLEQNVYEYSWSAIYFQEDDHVSHYNKPSKPLRGPYK